MPELAPLLDDPNWVTKDGDNITQIRAELLPLFMRQNLNVMSNSLTRAATPKNDVLGNVLGGLALGVITGGFGLAGAGALGLSGATANAAAGAIGGAMSSGIKGGDPLTGALTGGIGGYIGGSFSGVGDSMIAQDAAQLISSGISPDQVSSMLSSAYGIPSTAASTISQLTSLGITDPTIQSSLIKGLSSGTMTAVGGGDIDQALINAIAAGGSSYLGGKTGQFTDSPELAKLVDKVSGNLIRSNLLEPDSQVARDSGLNYLGQSIGSDPVSDYLKVLSPTKVDPIIKDIEYRAPEMTEEPAISEDALREKIALEREKLLAMPIYERMQFENWLNQRTLA
jgi:hypothetical protein